MSGQSKLFRNIEIEVSKVKININKCGCFNLMIIRI